MKRKKMDILANYLFSSYMGQTLFMGIKIIFLKVKSSI